jgi:hypothetical protein
MILNIKFHLSGSRTKINRKLNRNKIKKWLNWLCRQRSREKNRKNFKIWQKEKLPRLLLMLKLSKSWRSNKNEKLTKRLLRRLRISWLKHRGLPTKKPQKKNDFWNKQF